jgi:hypothetical protein
MSLVFFDSLYLITAIIYSVRLCRLDYVLNGGVTDLKLILSFLLTL